MGQNQKQFRILSSFVTVALLTALSSSAFAAAKVITISTKGDELAFNLVKLSAKPGQEIKLTFSNKSNKTSGMSHNFVLAQPGTETEVANAGMAAGAEKGWIAEGPNVVAHTKLLNAGESDTISFVAPKAGEYPYFCSFPGHSALMKGVLSIK